MVSQKRNNGSKDALEPKNKSSDKGNKRKGSDVAKQVKEETKKILEESSLSSEDLSNDTMSANRGSDESEGGGSAEESSNSSTPDSNNGSKKSNMAKIPFEPGLRLEAKDLGNEIWYAVKVVEVDWEEEEILIHFEKWSQRYDEWISMDSSRLRPIQEAAAAKSSKKSSSKVFKVGDRVNATWSDSRKYPATVKAILPEDKYEVLFMDGYTKIIKGARMAKLKPSDMINAEEFDPEKLGAFKVPEKPLAPPVLSPLITDAEVIGTKAERRERKRKLNVAELFHVKKRPKRSPPRTSTHKRSDSETGDKSMEEEKERKLEKEDVDTDVKKEEESAGPMDTVDSSEAEPDSKPDQPKLTDEKPTVEENSVESEGKPRRKITPKVRDEDEEEMRPRRQGKRIARTSESSNEGKRGPGRKKQREDKDSEETSSIADNAGTSQDSSTVGSPKSKKNREDVEKPMSRKTIPDNWEPEGEPAYIVESAEGLRKSIIVADERLPEGWIKHMIQRKGGHSAGKWDVFFVCPAGRKFRSRHELRNYFEERGEEFPRDQFDFSLGRRKLKWRDSKKSSSPGQGISGIGKLQTTPSTGDLPVRRVKTLLPKVRLPQSEDGSPPGSEGPRSPLPPYTTSVSTKGSEDGPDGAVLVGSLKIQMENDAYICPKEGCGKHFRKENLLQMHLKHYHPEYNKFMGSTPNVADLAYARTIGEPVEDLIPKSRYSMPSPMFLDKFNRFEPSRKGKILGGSPYTPIVSAVPVGTSTAPDIIPYDRRKSQGKKMYKGEVENISSELCLTSEDSTSLPERPEVPPALEPAVSKDEPQPTIKTLLPVVRPPAELTLVERLKMRCPTEDAVGDALLGKDNPVDLPPQQQPPVLQPQIPPTSQSSGLPNLTKSMRTVKRKHMTDFHMEPIMKKRKSVKAPDLLPEDAEFAEDGTLIGYGKRKLPMVHVEKLATTTDSNATLEGEDRSKSPQLDSGETRVEQLRREEIINCICGYNEEDGLMIQCDLCLCWQHGLCSKIEKEEDVPEKYVCPICLNPYRERKSKHYMHDQDWLKEGKLPSLSFRSKNLETVKQREMILKRTNELVATLHQLDQVLHSLKVKCNVAKAKDHPKLYLWAKSWQHQDPRTELIKQAVYRFLRPKTEGIKPQDLCEASTSQEQLPATDIKEEEEDLKEDKDELFSSADFSHLVLPSEMKEEEGAEPFPVPMSEDEFASLIPSEGGCARATPLLRRERRPPSLHPTEKEESTSKISTEISEGVSPETPTDNLNISIGSTESYDLSKDDTKQTIDSVENVKPPVDNREITECSKGKEKNPETNAEPPTDDVKDSVDPNEHTEKSVASAEIAQPSSKSEELVLESVEMTESSTQDTDLTVGSTENNESKVGDAKTIEVSNAIENFAGEHADTTKDSHEITETSMDSCKTGIETPVDDIKTVPETTFDHGETAVNPQTSGPQEEDKVSPNSVENKDDDKLSEDRSEEENPQSEKETKMDVVMSEPQEKLVSAEGEAFPPMEEIVGDVEEIVGLSELTAGEEMVETEGSGSVSEENTMKAEGGMFSMPPPPPPSESNLLHKALTNKPGLSSQKEVDLRKIRLRQILAAKVQQAFKKRAPVPEPLIDSTECKLRLLDHIDHYHQQIEERLTTIEAQLTALESMDPYSVTDEKPEYCPRTKQTILMVMRDLMTMQRLGSLF